MQLRRKDDQLSNAVYSYIEERKISQKKGPRWRTNEIGRKPETHGFRIFQNKEEDQF